jgi:hypothetical protein
MTARTFLPIVPAVDEQNTWMRSSCTTAARPVRPLEDHMLGLPHTGLKPYCSTPRPVSYIHVLYERDVDGNSFTPGGPTLNIQSNSEIVCTLTYLDYVRSLEVACLVSHGEGHLCQPSVFTQPCQKCLALAFVTYVDLPTCTTPHQRKHTRTEHLNCTLELPLASARTC